MMDSRKRVHLRFPATSANLGPGFDTAAVALDLALEITARPAKEFSIEASGRDADVCGRLEDNLVLDTYRQVLTENGRTVQPLHLEMSNAIPLGMGCGSSAAARLAAIALAMEFGSFSWSDDEVLSQVTRLEGHSDNGCACWLGSMTVSVVDQPEPDAAGSASAPRVHVARFDIPSYWRPVLVFPSQGVRTETSRKVLPDRYTRADVIANLQHTALLVAAFASGRSDLLRAAMKDRLHQPYRAEICPLLRDVEGIAGIPGVLGAALSGAGPGMLLIVDRDLAADELLRGLDRVLGVTTDFYMLTCEFEARGASATTTSSSTLAPKRSGF